MILLIHEMFTFFLSTSLKYLPKRPAGPFKSNPGKRNINEKNKINTDYINKRTFLFNNFGELHKLLKFLSSISKPFNLFLYSKI